MPVSSESSTVGGLDAYAGIDTLPLTPDIAVICSAPGEVPGILDELGARGVRSAVIPSRGFFRSRAEDDSRQRSAIRDAARRNEIRLLGPNCLGFINPVAGVNISLAHRDATAGKIAFVTQSDSLFTSVLDWASSKNIGFSHFISLGDSLDVRLDNVLDYLNADPGTRLILLYIETIENARRFMSAARAAARNKPVLVVKAGRSEQGARAAEVHTGAYHGADDVYDAAFRRAGMLRVFEIDILFDTVETLVRTKGIRGERLAVITNGGSPGFMAVDSLVTRGGSVAELSDETRHALREELGDDWSYWNPLVIKSNAAPETYAAALRILLKDRGVDGVVVMHVPTALVPSDEVADAVAKAARRAKRPVLTSWLGIDDAAPSRLIFQKAGIPSFFTPDQAIRAFLNLSEYHRNQELLLEAPPSLPEDFDPDVARARSIVEQALAGHRQLLTEDEAMEILDAYRIPCAATRIVADLDGVAGVVEAAADLGFPVAVKVLSPDIARKSTAGGVALDLDSETAVRSATRRILNNVRRHRPDARVLGFTVQRMSRRARAHELSAEIATDPVFGPVIRFGEGGTLPDSLAEKQATLPPVNMTVARELVSRSRVAALLGGYRDRPAADVDAICHTLTKLSHITIDIPEIFELKISHLLADDTGVVALDALVGVALVEGDGVDHLAIRPYPRELEEPFTLRDGREVLLRPILPEDEPAHWEFIDSLSAEDKRYRFFGNIAELPRSEMIRFTQIDYDREMAFIAVGPDCGEADPADLDHRKTLAVVRAMTSPDNSSSEFAIVVRSDCKRLGLGRVLMEKIIRYCRERGTGTLKGQALGDNTGMVALARAMGFSVAKDYDDDIFDFRLDLQEEAEEA